MTRLRLLCACFAGSLVAGVIGLVAAIMWDMPFLAWICAAVLPVAFVFAAGLRSRSQLGKIAIYALLGWGVCYVLAPTSSESPGGRERRIAADPLKGCSWYIPCTAVSWLMASIGVGFAPLKELHNREGNKSTRL